MWNKASKSEPETPRIIKFTGGRHLYAVQPEEGLNFTPARVIAVSSGKGGVGKTSLVVNLAITLAAMGQRVVVFDADLGMANAEVLMGITPPSTLFDCLYGDKELEDIIIPGPCGIKLVSGGSGFLELANLDSTRRQRLIESLAYFDRETDFLIIDTGAGISKNVLGFVAAAGEVIVVVTPEPTSLTDAYSLIKVLAMFKVHSEVMMVINRAADEREARRTAQRVENVVAQFLQIRVNTIGWIIEDKLVSQAVKKQEPFSMFYPHSLPSQSISKIAKYLTTGQRQGGAWAGAGSGARGFIRRLARLFG
ncbi:MAG: MinD/ParA family protein [Peptococcaceae bacterium]|nr:MinD/ParA family protein [Peptococcaceae bacterium]